MTRTPPRVVFDEFSVRFDELLDTTDHTATVEAGLEALADALFDFRASAIVVVVSPFLADAECWPGVLFAAFLGGQRLPTESGIAMVDRDSRLRLSSLLSKCPEWNDDVPFDVSVNGHTSFAPSIAWAHGRQAVKQRVACLVFQASQRRGEVLVTITGKSAMVWFLAGADELPAFLRTLFEFENVGEQEFFQLASQAFPRLRFASSLSFGKFEGSYRELRAPVVQHLGAINDHFLDALHHHQGKPWEVAQELGGHGCNISRESEKTRQSKALMTHRDVEHHGTNFRCEWHSKLQPDKNRIHFVKLDDQSVFIGIFVKHLPI